MARTHQHKRYEGSVVNGSSKARGPKWALGGAIVLICALGAANLARLVPYAPVWGDIATWAQALLTGGGLVFAGLSVRLATKQLERSHQQEEVRREETKEAARQGVVLRSSWTWKPEASSRAGRLTYNYEIANMSAFAVSNCKISVHTMDDENADLYDLDNAFDSDDFYQAVVVGTLVPGEVVRGRVIVRNPAAAIGLPGNDRVANPDLFFTDTWGVNWLRARTTHFRVSTGDFKRDGPECMCCGALPDSRTYVGSRPIGG